MAPLAVATAFEPDMVADDVVPVGAGTGRAAVPSVPSVQLLVDPPPVQRA
jgi:hypothetical protein